MGSSVDSKKLQDIMAKNRRLEESINQLKQELSSTSFGFGSGNDQLQQQQQQQQGAGSFFNGSFSGVPSMDRMQQLHRRRQQMQNNALSTFMSDNGLQTGTG